MIPRRLIDIGGADLAYGIGACFVPGDRSGAPARTRLGQGARVLVAYLYGARVPMEGIVRLARAVSW